MLTPREMPTADVPAAEPAAPVLASRWRRMPLQLTRRNVIPWLAVKGALTALVFLGQMDVWTAFVLDTAVSLAVVLNGWRLARRQA